MALYKSYLLLLLYYLHRSFDISTDCCDF